MDGGTELLKFTHLPDELIENKHDKDPNVLFYKRVVILQDQGDDSVKHHICEIKRTKVTKIGSVGVKKRMEIPKFGISAGQTRGTVESGIIRMDQEMKIVDRKKACFQESLKEKLKGGNNSISKEDFMQKMIAEQERDKKVIIEKLNQNVNPFTKKARMKKREVKETDVKITGFNLRCEESDLIELFEKVGRVKRCIILRDRLNRSIKRNIAYLEFEDSINVAFAIDKYNNITVGNSVLNVCRPADDEF